MKNLIIVLSIFLALSTSATSQTSAKSSKEVQKTTYTCSMHPEVVSSKTGKCPKCGMTLVEKPTVKNNVSSKKGKVKPIQTKLYACPMHPESKGKLNDKCPKCGMKLTEEVK